MLITAEAMTETDNQKAAPNAPLKALLPVTPTYPVVQALIGDATARGARVLNDRTEREAAALRARATFD